jgi:hypothetical protein
MSGDFISVSEALKLIPPFKWDKQQIMAFIETWTQRLL